MTDNSDEQEPPSRSPLGELRGRLARMIGGAEFTQLEDSPTASDGDPTSLRVKEFEDASVRDVMTSRADITGVEVRTTLEDVLKLFVKEAHSRMPVYRDSLDDPIGFIHIKDIVAELMDAGWSAETLSSQPLERLARKVIFVPESMPLSGLLQQMKTLRTQMALVVDEFGGTDGLVCLEDLIEEIVGDLEDEHDDTTPMVKRRGRNTWDVDGLADIEDVEEATGLTLHVPEFADEVDTLGGLVSALAGRVPQASDSIIHPQGFVLDVLAADPRRVMRVRIRPATKSLPPLFADDEVATVDRRQG